MSAFEKMQERLREEGWYVGWNEPCCQSCAWGSLPYYLDEEKGIKVDLSKVLFNHSQDCEVYLEGEECPECHGEGIVENPDYDTDQLAEEHDDDLDEFIDCPECWGAGEIEEGLDPSQYDTSVSGFVCYYPEQLGSSYFCFDGSKEGVENFKAIMPIIEECGVSIDSFDESGKSRITLRWG